MEMPGKNLASILLVVLAVLTVIPIQGCAGDLKCLIMEKACEIRPGDDPGGACGMDWGTSLESFRDLAAREDMELPGQLKAYESRDRTGVTYIFNGEGEYMAALVAYEESTEMVLECLQEKFGRAEKQDFEGHGLYAWSGGSTSFVLAENTREGKTYPLLFILSVELARELPELLGIAY